MSYIIAEHQSATQENGASHKRVIIFLAKIVIKSDNTPTVKRIQGVSLK